MTSILTSTTSSPVVPSICSIMLRRIALATSTMETPYSTTTVTSTAAWVSPFWTLIPPATLVWALGMRSVTALKARRTALPISYTPGTSRVAMPAILATTFSSMVVTPCEVCRGPRGVLSCLVSLLFSRSRCWPVWGMELSLIGASFHVFFRCADYDV